MNVSFNWLKDYIDLNNYPIEDLAHRLTMCGLEIKKIIPIEDRNDVLLEAEVTSNRPDWLGYVGIAREIGAIIGKKIIYPNETIKQKREKNNQVNVIIKDIDLCPFYTAVLLENVEFGETPRFIQDRLTVIGVRTINLPVDLTNYILFEYSQPLHAFDFDKIGDSIIIRRAQKREKFIAINEKEYVLDQNDLVISDEKGAIAIAGVMGGLQSEVSQQTHTILLESAFFNPVAVRKTSRKVQLVSESSYRFERRVDPQNVVNASNRFVHLLSQFGKIGKVSSIITAGSVPIKSNAISLPHEYVKNILGISIPTQTSISILENLGLHNIKEHDNTILVEIPSFRSDLERPIDLIEEIARIYGYDRIPETYPFVSMNKNRVDKSLKCEELLRNHAIALGADEIVTYNLVNPNFYERFFNEVFNDAIRIINPSNKELTLMRPSLITGMLDVIKTNIHHGHKNIKAFEVGRVYLKNKYDDLPREEKMFSLSITGQAFNNWVDHKRMVNFFDLKGMMENILAKFTLTNITYASLSHPLFTDGVQIIINEQQIGTIGKVNNEVLDFFEIDQHVFYCEISISQILNNITWEKKFIGFSRFPSSHRDLSIVIDGSVKACDVITTIRSCGHGLIKDLILYDQYSGKQIPEGFKSFTFSIEYQANDRTLSSIEIESIHNTIVTTLERQFKAKLRD